MWSELAHAQLKEGQVAEAIASYLLAQDSSNYSEASKNNKCAASRAGPAAGARTAVLEAGHAPCRVVRVAYACEQAWRIVCWGPLCMGH